MLPSEAILRALWPWERDSAEVAKQLKNIDFQRTSHVSSSCFQKSINRLRKTSAQSESTLSDRGTTQWVNFLEPLVLPPTEETHQAITRACILRDSSVGTNPYQVPFNTLSLNFLLNLHKFQHRQFTEDRLANIYFVLADWYVSSAIRCSRYALHVTYKRSGLTWEKWAKQFDANSLTHNPWVNITTEYPVLLRRMAAIQLHASSALQELLTRLDTDRRILFEFFNIPMDAKLSAVQPGLSDPHRMGRTVFKLVFNDRTTLFYKPKPVDIELAFNEFVKKEKPNGLRNIKVLPRSNYGWAEAVEHQLEFQPLDFPESVGAATACFWLLNATDLHVENIFTDKSGVLAVDLETLLTAPINNVDSNATNSWKRHSINATLLFNAQVGPDRHLANISGFNAAQDTPTVPLVNFLLQGNEIQLVKKAKNNPIPGLPRRDDQAEKDAVRKVIESFQNSLSPDNTIKIKKFLSTIDPNCQLRFVPRATNFYVQLLERISQPRFLRDGSELAFDLMSMHTAVQNGSEMESTLHAIVDDEISQLLRGDIPYFYTKADHQHLYTSSERLPNFFSSSGISSANRKLDNFERSDIDEQSALLAISLGDKHAYAADQNVNRVGLSTQPLSLTSNTNAQNLLELANHIVRSSFQPSREPARWLSLYGDVSGNDLRAEAGDCAFFGGAWGILLAIQAVASSISNHTDTSNLKGFLDDQAKLWKHQLERNSSPIQSLGFAGLGGEFFSHSQLIALDTERWGFLSISIENRLNNVIPSIKNDSWLDIIGGTSGLLLGCSKLGEHSISPKSTEVLLNVISHATTHLINSSTKFAGSTTWLVPGEQLPLLGYAHGWAGIVVALSNASKYCDLELQREISKCLTESRDYPESLYQSSGQWYDHRSANESLLSSNCKPLDSSWCNGAPGLLRGLLELELSEGDVINDGILHLTNSIHGALTTSKAYRFCCGEMGNVDLLLDLASLKNSADTRSIAITRAREIVNNTIHTIHKKEEGEVPELIFPGLFQGLSGIAYCGARTFNHHLPSLSGQNLCKSSLP